MVMYLPKKCDSEQWRWLQYGYVFVKKSVTRGCDVQYSMVMHFMTSSTKGSDTEYGDVLLK